MTENLAKSAKSQNEIKEKLIEYDIENTTKLNSFCEELYDKFAIKNQKQKLSEYEKHEINMIKKRNFNESFKLIESKPAFVTQELKQINSDKVKEKDKDILLGKKRETKDEVNEGSNEKNENEEIDYDKIFNINSVEDKDLKNLLKEKDRLERDLLDKKLKEKETDKNKRGKTLENPLLAKINLSEDEKLVIASQLRKMSRYSYLKMRTSQQLDLWKRKIEDEQKLFNGVQLSEEEIKINEINQKIYELASQRLEENPEQENLYKMPDGFEDEKGNIDFDKKYKVLYERYKEHKKEEREDEVWEKQQKIRSLPKYGALNVEKPADKFSLVLENQIDFVQKDILEGYVFNNPDADKEKIKKKIMKRYGIQGDKKKNEEDENESSDEEEEKNIALNAEELKIQEMKKIREGLPIYSYKDELLAAIRDYQVLVIVGETGSGKINYYFNLNLIT
jgi:pre-mRNA-splicing factor ATP-dependent RNA helicase DHX16